MKFSQKTKRAYYTRKTNTYHKTNKNIRFLFSSCLTDKTRLNYINLALAKSSASRGKLNLSMANSSTPVLTRAFFVRSVYAPIQNNLSFDRLFSMVARNGQPLAVGCFPLIAVFHPVTCYRPTVESLAVVPENLLLELTQMYQFIFALIRAPQIKIRLLADNEQQARSRFTDGDTLLFVGKINQNPLKNNHTLAALPTLSVSATQGGENV